MNFHIVFKYLVAYFILTGDTLSMFILLWYNLFLWIYLLCDFQK